MKLNKLTQDAIDRNLPVHLEWDYWRTIRLIAQTAQHETGAIRTRKLYEGDLPKIMQVIKEVFASGGAVNIDDLPWRDMPAYQISTWLNWSPELEPVREELRKLWRERPARRLQPDW